MKVFEHMTPNPRSVAPDDSIAFAAELMGKFGIGALPVCADDKLVGIVTDRDITIRATRLGSPPDSTNVAEVMSENVRSLREDSDLGQAEQLMATARIRRVPVVDSEARLVGILSLSDLAVHLEPQVSAVLRAISREKSSNR